MPGHLSLDAEKPALGFEDDIPDDTPYESVKERKVLIQPYDYAVRTLMDMIVEGDLKLDPDYQRNYRWDDEKASRFIESIALNIPVPVLYFAEEPDGSFSVIDGQQRLTSLFRYIKFEEAKHLFPNIDITELTITKLKLRPDLNEKKFLSLEREDRSLISKRPIRCIVVLNESDATLKFEVFERLNTGSSQLTEQEVRNCIYNGSFSKLIKELSKNDKYLQLISLPNTAKKNMTDAELVLRFFAYKELDDDTQYPDNYTEYLNTFMEHYRWISPSLADHFRTLFNSTVDILYDALGPNVAFRKPSNLDQPESSGFATNLINGSIFESQMVAVARLLESRRELPSDLRTRLLSGFLDSGYRSSVFQGTAQKSKALRRNKILSEIVAR